MLYRIRKNRELIRNNLYTVNSCLRQMLCVWQTNYTKIYFIDIDELLAHSTTFELTDFTVTQISNHENNSLRDSDVFAILFILLPHRWKSTDKSKKLVIYFAASGTRHFVRYTPEPYVANACPITPNRKRWLDFSTVSPHK